MPRIIRLQPHKTETVEDLPLGFEAGADLAAGNVYADSSGKLVSKAELDKQLREQGTRKRMIRALVRFRMPGDPVEQELRSTYVNVPVIGDVDSEEAGRLIHTAIRNVHNAIRERGKTRG